MNSIYQAFFISLYAAFRLCGVVGPAIAMISPSVLTYLLTESYEATAVMALYSFCAVGYVSNVDSNRNQFDLVAVLAFMFLGLVSPTGCAIAMFSDPIDRILGGLTGLTLTIMCVLIEGQELSNYCKNQADLAAEEIKKSAATS